jgi:hypothetical protein
VPRRLNDAQLRIDSDMLVKFIQRVMKPFSTIVGCVCICVFITGCTGVTKPKTNVAYFAFKDSSEAGLFVFELNDAAKIAEARTILAGNETHKVHVSGTIVKSKASYNTNWNYHFAPDSIAFFEVATEVCDSTMRYVEDHLSDVGGAFLPKNHWCPWSSKLVKEVSPEMGP